jgi:hypothetical protein
VHTVKWLSTFVPIHLMQDSPLPLMWTTFASHFFDCKATVSKMIFSTLFPSTHSIQAPFKESIKSLVRVVCVGLLMTFYEGLELRKELLNRIQIRQIQGQIYKLNPCLQAYYSIFLE